jgi:hypothetical protein
MRIQNFIQNLVENVFGVMKRNGHLDVMMGE